MEFLCYEMTIDTFDDITDILEKRKTSKNLRLVNRRLNKLIISNARFDITLSNTREVIGYLPAFPGPTIYFMAYRNIAKHITHNNLITYVATNNPKYDNPKYDNHKKVLGMNIYDATVKYNEEHMSRFGKLWRWFNMLWYSLLYTWYYQRDYIVFPILYELIFAAMWYFSNRSTIMIVAANVILFMSFKFELDKYYIPSCGHVHKSVQVITSLPSILERCIPHSN